VVTNSEILPKFSLSCEPHLLRCACAITAYWLLVPPTHDVSTPTQNTALFSDLNFNSIVKAWEYSEEYRGSICICVLTADHTASNETDQDVAVGQCCFEVDCTGNTIGQWVFAGNRAVRWYYESLCQERAVKCVTVRS
jgi:hypothetical protein